MLRFDHARVDVAGRAVQLDGVPQHLEPQAFDLLVYLIAHRDRVVPKSELLDEVWGDQFVSESALTTRVKEIRRALGDDGSRQRIVRNYRGRGYRFVAEVEGEPTSGDPHHGTGSSITSLLGRADDIAEVTSLLERSAVVTLTGPGGVGKTALALEVARHAGLRHPGGVTVVPLAPVQAPSNVVHVLRRRAGLSDAGPTEADLVASIADLDVLLVIDNCEHVIDEAARLIGAIAARGGSARVLATSRERLGVGSEQVRPVMPLDPVPARELLVARARSILPGWSADDESSVDRLVDLVDRLPLAIEMAAARLPSIGLEDLIELLGDRLDLLRSPDRNADERHSTLPALIEWSENLLEPEARQLLTDLSVFAGPVTGADIASVAGADTAELVAGPLAGLVEHSLVVAGTVHQPTRYHLLETVRACVARRREPSVDERHAHHIADVLREADRALRTPEEPVAADRIESLTTEIRAAHRWAGAHAPGLAAAITTSLLHYAHERQWAEPAAWNEELVARTGDDDEHAAPAAAAVAAVASDRNAYQQARILAERAARSPDPIVATSGHDTLANVGIYTGDLDSARRHSAALLEIADQTADPVSWTLGMVDEVLAWLYAGIPDQARALLDRSKPPGPLSPTCSAWVAYAEGEVHAAQDLTAEALDWFDTAITAGSTAGSHFVVGVAQLSALATRSRSGDIDEAMAAFAPIVAHYRRIRSLTHGITALRNLVGLLVRAERDEPAMVLLGALSNPDIKTTYGAESELLTGAHRTLRARNPAGAVARWNRRGAAHDTIWALDYAIEVLTDNGSTVDQELDTYEPG